MTSDDHQPDTESSADWIQALLNPAAYPHSVDCLQLIETHISWLLLTGRRAYKIKKPVNLGFADFTTLERRRFFCHEELRLNRRLAPELYLSVVPVTGSRQQPVIDGRGEVIEYAVCMLQFDNNFLLSRLADRGELTADWIDQLADLTADFHGRIDCASADSEDAEVQRVVSAVLGNFNAIRLLPDGRLSGCLRELEGWTIRQCERLQGVFRRRADRGMIRECHGDMHLGNMYIDDSGHVRVFDGIEFNAAFRWIDIISEIAFTMMDLEDRELGSFSWRYLNRWLETTGDFDGLQVLRFYLVYRALVRVKVGLIRVHQPLLDVEQVRLLNKEVDGYLRVAQRFRQTPQPLLAITCGMSGSGKTSGTQLLMEAEGMIRVRSDVERRRMSGISLTESSHSAPLSGIYTPESTAAVYGRLLENAEQILEAGFPCVVDATFLKSRDRQLFCSLARRLHVPFVILYFNASPEELRQRVRCRQQSGSDASEATEEVIDLQQQSFEAFTDDERPDVLDCSSAMSAGQELLNAAVRRIRESHEYAGSDTMLPPEVRHGSAERSDPAG